MGPPHFPRRRRRPPASVHFDGYNLLPAMMGKGQSARQDCFWQRQGDKPARVGPWKWVESRRGNGLFNLDDDVNESRDLSAAKPDVLAMMKQRWSLWRKEMDDAEPRGPFRDY